VTLFEITHAERVGWQRRAAHELAAILDAHPELPIIGWTLASAGSIVVGHVTGPGPADQLRLVFDAWRSSLLLSRPSEVVLRNGTVLLKASADRNRVRVTVTATLTSTLTPADGEVAP
jgi:hypothetical protein